MPALEAYRRIWSRLIEEAGRPDWRPGLDPIWEALFDGFNPEWLLSNQKFDFSVSIRRASGLRLSFSDYGEKSAFPARILRIFRHFGEAYDLEAAKSMFAVAEGMRGRHQTNFGFDWPPGAPLPRLKIYFEELRDSYPRAARMGLLRGTCRAVGLPVPAVPSDEDMAALCVDFFPDRSIQLKTYAYRASPEPGEEAAFGAFTRTLSREPRCFFYKTLRYGDGGRIDSIKWYKVYEVQRIASFTPGFEEIYDWLESSGDGLDKDRIEGYRAVASSEGAQLYPVLFAMDISAGGATRVDGYFSVR